MNNDKQDHIGDTNKMVTAVEWLEKQFDKYTSGGVNVPNNKIFKLTEKAKSMEKEQIEQAKSDGYHEAMSEAVKEIHKNYQPI